MSSRPKSNSSTRRRLTGIGESLTSEEAIERLRKEEEEKKKKEEEKLERKRKREEKKKEKGSKSKRKQTKVNKEDTCSIRQSRAMCLECQTYYDMDEGDEGWIECEKCFDWYHMECVGIEQTADKENVSFVCDFCV